MKPSYGDPIVGDEQGEIDNRLKISFVRRIILVGAMVLAGLLLLFGRMFYLQIYRHRYYSTRSLSNRIRIRAIVPERGTIFDRKGRPLTENILRYRVVIQPSQTPDVRKTIEALQRYLPLSAEEIDSFLKSYRKVRRYENAVIKQSITEEERYSLAVKLYQLAGVEIETYYERYYPYGSLLSHVIGYINRISEKDQLDENTYRGLQFIGRMGLEREYEERLRGHTGYQQLEADVNGNLVRVLEEVPAVRGQDIYLSLDIDLQKFMDEALGDYRGSCVAIDTESGEVLAMVSKPSFDANLFSRGITAKQYKRLLEDENTPLYNRALNGRYPPGSVIKPVMALAGFHYHIFNAYTPVHCSGYYTIPDSASKRRFHCWNRRGHGTVSMDKAIAQSCDIYFYTLGYSLGIDRMADFCQHFGLGRRTGVDLPDEGSGIMPSKSWKEKRFKTNWYIGDTINASIGQGFMTTTPLQLAYMTALLARDGRNFTPRLLNQVYDPATKRFLDNLFPSTSERLAIYRAGDFRAVRLAMEHVVHAPYGTGRGLSIGLSYRMAGKSGTVQVVSFQSDRRPEKHEIKDEHQDNAMFIAYAPANAPKIAVSVVVERGGGGSSTAGPIARQILDYYLLGKKPSSDEELLPDDEAAAAT